MKVNKAWLEAKIKELNDWLQLHQTAIHFEYAKKKNKRDHYVNKLIEMENQNLKIISV